MEPRFAAIEATPVLIDSESTTFPASNTGQRRASFQDDQAKIELLIRQSKSGMDAVFDEFGKLPQVGATASVASSFEEEFDELDASSDALYAALVQHDCKVLDMSDVGLDCSGSTEVINADMVVAGRDFYPPGVSGMSVRLIVAKVQSPDYNVKHIRRDGFDIGSKARYNWLVTTN